MRDDFATRHGAIASAAGEPTMSARFSTMPGHLLRRCQQIAVAIFLDACVDFELTPLQFAVLESLYSDGPQDQVTLGGATALDRTTITVLLRNLERRGLVQRDKSRLDQRSKIVSVTPAGKRLLEAALPAVEAAQRRIVEPLDTDETERLLELLEKLARDNNALSRAPERRSARRGQIENIDSRSCCE